MNTEEKKPVTADATPEKRAYRKPEFIAHGAVEDVTLGSGSGATLEIASYVSVPF